VVIQFSNDDALKA